MNTSVHQPMPRALLSVDLSAIRANVAALRERVAPALFMAVVKADGYGHGMVEVARAAREAGADWLGAAVLDEALALRAAGDRGRLMSWLASPGEDFRPAVEADIDLAAYSAEQLGEIVAASRTVGSPARVHLKIDTGLGRGGAVESDWPALVRAGAEAHAAGAVQVVGAWSHLACADDPQHPANDQQEKVFRWALDVVAEAGIELEVAHIANSAAALTRPTMRFDMVRCGIATYGLSPVPSLYTSADLGLRPAMTATARLAVVKRVPAGAGVSYGHTYVTAHETSLAVVPVGYADGVMRTASCKAPVQVAGRRRSIAGRVCMDQFVVDVEDDAVDPGDEVVLFGPGDGGEPTAQDWAEACGTISYEIVTKMGGRFVRKHSEVPPGGRGGGR